MSDVPKTESPQANKELGSSNGAFVDDEVCSKIPLPTDHVKNEKDVTTVVAANPEKRMPQNQYLGIICLVVVSLVIGGILGHVLTNNSGIMFNFDLTS